MNHTTDSHDCDELLTTERAAALLACSLPTIRRLAASGKLTCVRLGRLVRFRRADILALVA